MTQLQKAYKQINQNEGNKGKLLYTFGPYGVGSEIFGITEAILYCLHNEIEFCFNTYSWNSKYKRGWQDYFVPFYDEEKSISYRQKLKHFGSAIYSNRYGQKLKRFGDAKCNNKFSPFVSKLLLKRDMIKYSKAYRGYLNSMNKREKEKVDLYQFNRGEFTFNTGHFTVPELGINGNYFHAMTIIMKMIYVHNEETIKAVNQKKQSLKITQPYIAVHIRKGDKKLETVLIETIRYIDRIKKLESKITNIFIASDDYNAVEEFQKNCSKEWTISTLCTPSMQGHAQGSFNRLRPADIQDAMIDVFTDLDILFKSEIFIGTYSSNIARLTFMFKEGRNCHNLDDYKWPMQRMMWQK